ncbi:DUF1398 domain-containing protein [Oryzifoliimicrobium ureilyticus]|uniref:DUF1398 domain-containing protein n=1 Tax=Oryzifoliimicrobium ureilyticus TaxID=3113724 RepID=UPI0030760CA4
MDAEKRSIAEFCLNASHDGSLGFPEIVGTLIEAGFESYCVDFRRKSQSYYLPDGDSITLSLPSLSYLIAPTFNAAEMGRLVRWAQDNPPDYRYFAFCEKAAAAGCAGYMVSFLGWRVVYFGRTAEIHVEHFPG